MYLCKRICIYFLLYMFHLYVYLLMKDVHTATQIYMCFAFALAVLTT